MKPVKIYVLQDITQDDFRHIIGVAESNEIALAIISEYYGDYELIMHRDIKDSGVEWYRTIKALSDQDETVISCQSFTLNEI